MQCKLTWRLYPAATLCLGLCSSLLAQDSRITGHITDASGAVVAAAVVTATQVRWAPDAAGSVSAAIAAIAADSTSSSANSSGGDGDQASVTPGAVTPPAKPPHKSGDDNCGGGDDEGDGEVAGVNSGPDGIGNQGHHGRHGHHGHGY